MAKVEQLNPYLSTKQSTNRDVRQQGVLVSAKYSADSTAGQTVININTFTVTQTTEQKRAFTLFIDGTLLSEGATADYTFTSVANGLSSQITLNAPLIAGLDIQAFKIGAYQENFPNASSVTANLNTTNLALDLKGNKNSLINGSFEIWQRATTFTAIANATYFADRWKYEKSGAAVHTITRDTDVPATAFGTYSTNLTVTTANASPGANDYVFIEQFIEGNFLKYIKSKNLVMQFWVKSAKTGVHTVNFRNSGNTKSLVKEYTVNAANTWEQKQIRFNHDSTGTWLYDTGIGMRCQFNLQVGTTYQGTKDIWNGTVIISTAAAVNEVDTIGNVFKLTDVMLIEDNSTLTALPNFVTAADNLAQELALCQRYYYNTSDGNFTILGLCATTALLWVTVRHPVKMRAAPTAGGIAGTYMTDNGSSAINSTTTPTQKASTVSDMYIQIDSFTGFTAQAVRYLLNTGTGYLTADAEL